MPPCSPTLHNGPSAATYRSIWYVVVMSRLATFLRALCPDFPNQGVLPVFRLLRFVFLCTYCLAATGSIAGQESKSGDEWIPLFNGKDLDGWTPKIRGHPLGDNFAHTFRVEQGVLKVAYDGYGRFDRTFGHIFYKTRFSHYRIRVEYRFVGEQVAGGPGWAYRNSGIMLHCQAPDTMKKDQDFPVSIEVQLLGGRGSGTRTTANLCTPGTNVEMNGKLFTPHCTSSRSKTYHGDQWVIVEVEVHGDKIIKHVIDGEVVLSYEKPQLDPRDADAKELIVNGNKLLSEGYISLQSESHPVEFRKVELLRLAP